MADAAPSGRPRPQAPLLVFVHVPKTAGTTVRTVLGMNEPGERTRSLSNVFKGSGGLDRALVRRLRKGRESLDLKNTMVLRGHLPLGIREYLPRYLSADREVRCFTLLREPIDRSLSHYFHIREKREGSHGPGKFVPPELPPEPTLDDMLERGYLHDNLHTRMLSGLPEPFGEVTDAMLEQAKQNLREELVFFGLVERFDESLVLAKQRLGFRSILYKTNGRVNPTRPRGDEVPKELVRSAERCNRYDIELYRYAEELFDNVPERSELEFEVEVAALRSAKVEPEIEPDGPAPERFGGDEQAWRMLLRARTTLLRLEWEQARSRVPRGETNAQHKTPESQLKVARARMKELEQDVKRLNTDRSRTKELEQEVKRLSAAHSRSKVLEQELERLKAAAGPRRKRAAKHRSPKAGRSGSKRASKRDGPKARGTGRKRASKRARPKAARSQPKLERQRPEGPRRDERGRKEERHSRPAAGSSKRP